MQLVEAPGPPQKLALAIFHTQLIQGCGFLVRLGDDVGTDRLGEINDASG